MSEESGIMGSECIIMFLCLISGKNSIMINYIEFRICTDILERNRIISFITAKYLLKADTSQYSLTLNFITKSL